MGHICEERTIKHATQHTNDFEDSLVQWVEIFIGQEYPKAVTRWENRIQLFSDKIRVRSCNKKIIFKRNVYGYKKAGRVGQKIGIWDPQSKFAIFKSHEMDNFTRLVIPKF